MFRKLNPLEWEWQAAASAGAFVFTLCVFVFIFVRALRMSRVTAERMSRLPVDEENAPCCHDERN